MSNRSNFNVVNFVIDNFLDGSLTNIVADSTCSLLTSVGAWEIVKQQNADTRMLAAIACSIPFAVTAYNVIQKFIPQADSRSKFIYFIPIAAGIAGTNLFAGYEITNRIIPFVQEKIAPTPKTPSFKFGLAFNAPKQAPTARL